MKNTLFQLMRKMDMAPLGWEGSVYALIQTNAQMENIHTIALKCMDPETKQKFFAPIESENLGHFLARTEPEWEELECKLVERMSYFAQIEKTDPKAIEKLIR